MSNRTEVLGTLTAAACDFALENVEQFKLHLEAAATEAGSTEMAENVPDAETLQMGLAMAGLAALTSARQPSLADLLGGGIGVTVMGPYSPDELGGQLPPELVELLTGADAEKS